MGPRYSVRAWIRPTQYAIFYAAKNTYPKKIMSPDVSVQKVMGKKGKSDREKLTCVRWMISYAK
jgi:hypothetical protein